jgi:hypothetical protein
MALIPGNEKVFMVDRSTNTTFSGSRSTKAMQQWYTMQDVIDSVNFDNGLSPDELDAINDANNPSASNPFATINDLNNELTTDEIQAINNANNPSILNPFATLADVGGGGGIEGTQYVYVAANGNPTENATELVNAYNTAKGMSPSSTNRITVIAAPGNYQFQSGGSAPAVLTMDTQYIDLISLDGNRSILFIGDGGINIEADNVFIKGVYLTQTGLFNMFAGLNSLKMENCRAGDYAFGFNSYLTGMFINCQSGVYGFGSGYVGGADGTFIDCIGSDWCFGAYGFANGKFINCESGNESFGSGGFSDVAGTFIDCRAGQNSFGYFNNAAGTFLRCTAGDNSFGFQSGANGIFTDCVAGQNSFGSFVFVSGTFTNCTGGFSSFGGPTATGPIVFNGINGRAYYCRVTSGGFAPIDGSGVIRLCLDGNNNIINQG